MGSLFSCKLHENGLFFAGIRGVVGTVRPTS